LVERFWKPWHGRRRKIHPVKRSCFKVLRFFKIP
jgi:hypothetical protein